MTIFLTPEKDKFLSEILREMDIQISSPCGGLGKCGKCKIKLISGKTDPEPDENGYVKACKTKPLCECEFYIPKEKSSCDYIIKDENEKYAIADVGTTTIKVRTFSNKGELLRLCSFLNPQVSFGADVISRISACEKGHFETLCKVLFDEIERHVQGVERIIFCGNPTMIHFLAEVDPTPLGKYPFECVFKDTKYIKRRNFETVLLPSASSYVGSDAICGIYSILKEHSENKTVLIADIGTNGEISLLKNGEIYSVSTAAGPAIEGASIEMGKCGGDGVIHYVDEFGTPHFHGEKATGINGAGLISFISYMRKKGSLSDEGDIQGGGCYYLTDEVYVSRKDISEFMVAKSAIKTSIELLLSETETSFSEIELCALTGGVLKEIKNKNDLFTSGIFQKELEEKACFLPDLAITGANTAVTSDEISLLEEIAKKTKVLYLSTHPLFEEKFIINTFFE